ncbi:MAG TPA: GNAT family N-acetyltransferase [Bacteroidota bacterium]|nr:GNAT family N-acetyltransferase [Bacteroidota bacterium]
MRSRANVVTPIRSLLGEDRPAIEALLVETDVFTKEEIDVALELVDAVLSDPNQRDYEICVAHDEERTAIGYYCIGPTPVTSGTYDLYWIAVKPSLHDRGVGKELLAHAEERIRSRGGRLVLAETSSQPKYEHTRRFYLRNGYAEVARIKEYYKPGDDLVVYGKYLSHLRSNEN